MTPEISNQHDIIDVDELIERVEHDADNDEEFGVLTSLLDALKGHEGEVQWRGNWYPETLIRASYFEHYARELAEETGAIPIDAWPCTCIDWEKAAVELQGMHYASVDFDGVTYWYRRD